jgi:DNA-binding NtrC family response regulator
VRHRILVVSGEPDLAAGLRDAVCEDEDGLGGSAVSSFEVVDVASAEAAMRELANAPPDLLLVDQDLPGTTGLELVRILRGRGVDVRRVLVVRREGLELGIRSLNEGADDFLVRPVARDALRSVVRDGVDPPEQVESLALTREIGSEGDRLVGRSPAILEVCRRVGRVAPSGATVLVAGESGTGKELIARLIHRNSSRSDGPFKALNCAALPDSLLESELFGHERGAFTGADSRQIGKFEAAAGGTLFLDEVGDMSPAHQRKILRALEERTIERVGGHRRIDVDVRVVAATHVDLWSRVEAGEFRRDLYYRLAVVELHMPPLRERPEDIRPLTDHFVLHFSRRSGRSVSRVAAGVYDTLRSHDWPGNVRELRNVLEQAVVMGRGPVLKVEELPKLGPRATGRSRAGRAASLLREFCRKGFSLEDLEKRYIRSVLEERGWHFGDAAEVLQIHRNTLRRKMRRYDLKNPAR